MEPEILHVPELARMLNRTECAIRSTIRDRANWLPPGFKQGVQEYPLSAVRAISIPLQNISIFRLHRNNVPLIVIPCQPQRRGDHQETQK